MAEPEEGVTEMAASSPSLSAVSPGTKKLKQARLPFAPVNKTQNKDVERKRKLSDTSDSNEPKKQVKLAKSDENKTKKQDSTENKKEVEMKENSTPLNADIKAKLSDFACSTKSQEKENVDKPRQVKPKKAKKKLEPEEVVVVDEESVQDRPDKMKGRVKMPFKKNKSRKSEEKKDDDSDIEILEDFDMDNQKQQENDKQEASTAEDDKKNESDVVEVTDKPEIESENKAVDIKEGGSEDTSMTDEWAEFHEKEMEKNPVEPPNAAIEKLVTPKSEKKKSALKKSTEKKKVESNDKTTDDKAKNSQAEVTKPKTNPLAKFLVKMTPGAIPNKKKTPVKPAETPSDSKDDEICILDEVTPEEKKKSANDKPSVQEVAKDNSISEDGKEDKIDDVEPMDTNTAPVEKPFEEITTPASKVSSAVSKTQGNLEVKSTPASIRAKQMAVTKLKVTVQELIIEMETAVEKEEFLKAHELKQKISSIESEINKIQEDEQFLSFSPSTQGIITSLSSTPVQSPALPKKITTCEATASTPSTTSNTDNCETPKGSADVKTPKSSQTKKPKVKKVTTPGSTDTTPKAPKVLTPKQLAAAEERRKKQLQLEEEKEKKRKEKELAKQDKERQKEIDKRVKEIERLEKERQRREKEREKEKEKKEKEEEKQKKKEEKEAELKKKEEEKAKLEEAKKKAEEQEEQKRKKAAEAFKGFFVKKETAKVEVESTEDKGETVSEDQQFNPFQVKQNMRLAPVTRADPVTARNRLDSLDWPSGPENLYLELLKTGGHVPEKQGKTWPWTKTEDDDVQVLEDEDDMDDDEEEDCEQGVMILGGRAQPKQHRAKLFQFHENQRPAYWGTWRKRSKFVSGRKPFGQDKIFDYEYDSDDDWEDEGEGESLSDAEDEKEEEDEYEVDNEFFVPHGYLSDGEEDKDDDEVFNPELEKEKLKLKEKEFEREIKKKTQQLKPRLWGCYWEPVEVDTETAALQLVKVLSGYAAIPCCNNNVPIQTSISSPQASPVQSNGDDVTESAKTKAKVKVSKVFPEEALSDLVRLTHMNINNKIFLAKEFIQFWSGKNIGEESSQEVDSAATGTSTGAATLEAAAPGCSGGQAPSTPTTATPGSGRISKKKVIDKIQEIADYKKVEGKTGKLWVVKPEILAQVNYESTDNTWTYILEQPNNRNGEDQTPGSSAQSRPQSPVQSTATSPNRAQLITKFTKVLSEDERARLNSTPPNNKKAKTNLPKQNGGSGAKVNMIKVKKAAKNSPKAGIAVVAAAMAAKASTSAAANGQVNKIAVKRKSDGKSPATSMIQVKRKPGTTPPINMIQVKKAPRVNQIPVRSSKAGDVMAQLKNLPGVSIQKIDNTVQQEKPADNPDCITID